MEKNLAMYANQEECSEKNHDLAGIAALRRLEKEINNKYNLQSIIAGQFLLSAFNGRPTSVSRLILLDMNLRKDLALVIIGVSTGIFDNDLIPFVFADAGKQGSDWFDRELPRYDIDSEANLIYCQESL